MVQIYMCVCNYYKYNTYIVHVHVHVHVLAQHLRCDHDAVGVEEVMNETVLIEVGQCTQYLVHQTSQRLDAKEREREKEKGRE